VLGSPCAAIDRLCAGAAPQRADACWTHRGTTGPGGVRASCRRDDSKTKAEQVDAGSWRNRKGPSLSAMGSRSTASPATRREPTHSGHVRATVRLLGVEHCRGLREVKSLPWQAFFSPTSARWRLAA